MTEQDLAHDRTGPNTWAQWNTPPKANTHYYNNRPRKNYEKEPHTHALALAGYVGPSLASSPRSQGRG